MFARSYKLFISTSRQYCTVKLIHSSANTYFIDLNETNNERQRTALYHYRQLFRCSRIYFRSQRRKTIYSLNLIDVFASPFANRQKRSQTQINLLPSSRFISKPFVALMNTSQANKDVYKIKTA